MAARSDILDALDNNADYRETGSLTKAKAYATALRQLMSPRHMVKRIDSGGQGEEVEHDLPTLKALLDEVNSWIDTNQGASDVTKSAVRHLSFNNYR